MKVLPQFIQMKEIKNKPKAQRDRRKKQVLDNFSAKIELLELRSESQEKSKTISNDQELIQSDPTSCPQNQKGNN